MEGFKSVIIYRAVKGFTEIGRSGERSQGGSLLLLTTFGISVVWRQGDGKDGKVSCSTSNFGNVGSSSTTASARDARCHHT